MVVWSEVLDPSHVSDPPPSSADVVAIGAGHNGLVAGYLAKAGMQVAVVEAATHPAG